MKIHITNIYGQSSKSTALIAQNTVAKIARTLAFNELSIYFYDIKVDSPRELDKRLDGVLAGVANGDLVIFQSPTWNDMKYDEEFVKKLKAYKNVKIAFFIHDVLPLMFLSNRYLFKRVINFYNQADVLIVPSNSMSKLLRKQGLKVKKIVIQEMWDCLTDLDLPVPKQNDYLNFIGDPQKFSFANNWNYDLPLHLFSTNAPVAGEKVDFKGWQSPTNLLLKLAEGGWGLVWSNNLDVEEYMKVCLSYKLSTYLAAGIPVVVKKEISNQKIIEDNKLGLVVNDLNEAVIKVKSLSSKDYQEYIEHTIHFAELLRNGFFTKKLLIETVHCLLRKD